MLVRITIMIIETIWSKIKRNTSIFIFTCLYSTFLSIFVFHFDVDCLNLKVYHRFNDDCCFSVFMYHANLHSFFINFISYRLFFWYDKFSILLCKKDNKVTWVQSYVALSLVIKFLKLLFRNDFASNFNLLKFALLFRFKFSGSRASEESLSLKYYFCCCYSVSIVFNLLFLFSVCRI